MSQEELAEKVGTTGQSIGRYEAGKRSITLEMLDNFAWALGCKPADLLADPESIMDDEERACLAGFKQLPPQHRENVLELIQGLIDSALLRELNAEQAELPPRRIRRWN